MEKSEITVAIGRLATCFGETIGPVRIKIYLEHLEGYSVEAVAKAVYRAEHEYKWFPKISEIIALIESDGRTPEDRAEEAWFHLRWSKQGRAYNPEALDDPVVKRCFQAMGGHSIFGMWDVEVQEQWRKKEFLKTNYLTQSNF